MGLADRCAGIADDVVLGYDDEVVGHQFKTARNPSAFRISSLLTGSDGLLSGLVLAWQQLRESCPGQTVRIRVVVSDIPSENDRLTDDGGTTRQFVEDWRAHPSWTLAEWKVSRWGSFVEHLLGKSSLDDAGFEEFLRHFELVHGGDPDFATRFGITDLSQPQVDRIAQRLPTLVARVPEQDRWTREAFLREMGWLDVETLHRHQFPVGAAVQRNPATEEQLRLALNGSTSGYVSLVGPPGSGKSTLLQIAFESEPRLVVVRYLAFVPGAAQGIGRAEAADFQEDLIVGLRRTGLRGLRFRRESPQERREELEALLSAAGTRFQETGTRTLIVVDGLDHVPREERPERSFLSELPLPASIPDGVVFLLGTQRVDLPGIPPSVRDQSGLPRRHVEIAPLSQGAISAMADAMGLPETISRTRLRELAQGHPLATHYLIEALLAAKDEVERASILDGGFEYSGDVEALYTSALRGLDDDQEIMDILGLIARSEAPLDLGQLEQFYSIDAIDRAWRNVRHLLISNGRGWSVFHNSFRLFVARIPRLRYGVPDPEYSTQLYRRLAEIAVSAGDDSPQRYLQLRYLLRSGAHQEALVLATPALFREQFLAGRSVGSIQDDIRLAFNSLKEVRDPTAAFRLIFSSDELTRRFSAIEQSDDTVEALIATGDVDDAEAFIEEVGGNGYAVVAAWLAEGNLDRARSLFERIEPLHDLGSDDGSTGGPVSQRSELENWVEQAIHFRTPTEILSGIDRIVEVAGRDNHPFQDPNDLGNLLRKRAAMAALAFDSAVDVGTIIADFRLEPGAHVFLRLWAAAHLLTRGRTADATALIEQATTDVRALSETSDWLRRKVALKIAHRNLLTNARSLFQGLAPPAISELDDSINYESVKHVTRAVMEYSELATLLSLSVATAPQSGKPQLRPLQQFSELAGQLAARSRNAAASIAHGEIAQECARFMRYVCRTRAQEAGEFFATSQLTSAASEVVRSLLESAARLGLNEFAMAVNEIDQVLADSPTERNRFVPLESVIACTMAQLGGNVDDAERRLSGLLERRDENTPSEFLSSTARLAVAFAQIGRKDRARALLAEGRAETLGYAVQAKKDPQYAFWIALLREANRIDPVGRFARVRTLARQAVGMTLTEGRDAAGRIAHEIIVEAMLDNAKLGISTALALNNADLIELPDVVDALMIGLVKRDPRRLRACVETWVSLCLPFHRAAYYRSESEGWFIREAMGVAAPAEVDVIANILQMNIEIHSQMDVRHSLLDTLALEVEKRGVPSGGIRAGMARLAGEPTLRRSGGDSPTRYDDVADITSLTARLDEVATDGSVDYDATKAFIRLIPTADIDVALALFDRHARISQDNRARFSLVDRALAVGRNDVAARLVNGYVIAEDRSASWSWTMGGGRRRYFQARLKLDGAAVHADAYANFASALAAGEEMTNSLLWDIDDIWPVLTTAPNWQAMWESVEEQLPCTRDYRLGKDIEMIDVDTDSALTAKLFHQLLALPIPELRWHAERGLSALADIDEDALTTLIESMLSGAAEEVIEGLRLARAWGRTKLRGVLETRVVALVDHDDIVVRSLAKALTMKWGLDVGRQVAPTPVFYSLALPPLQPVVRANSLRRRPFGPPAVSDVAAWSAPVDHLVSRLAEAAGVSTGHIRRRVQDLIESWGGLEAFGQPGLDGLEREMSKLGFRLTFRYPHVVGALRALRRIAGELERAGRISADEIDQLVWALGESQVPLRTKMDIRPEFVHRPTMPGFRVDEEDWLAAVEEDLSDVDLGPDTILAGVSHFHGRDAFTTYEWTRMRLFGTRLPARIDPRFLYDGLPVSAPAGLNGGPETRAWIPVCRVEREGLGSLPNFELTLDPSLTASLNWRIADDGSSTWADTTGAIVATAYCWRDGAPDGQTHGDCLWGEGAAIVLNATGRTQLEALIGVREFTAATARRSKNASHEEKVRFAIRPSDSP
ncbi:MAG TPA: hypothetical protein VFJ87_10615 [Rhodanobacteraceae bacterium]|nr:hypothetical protein [Rhodanobacteraceae bacterium]